jgi:DNA modification methylase
LTLCPSKLCHKPQSIGGENFKNLVDLIFADPPYNLSGNGLKWKGNKTGGDWYMVDEAWDKMTLLFGINFFQSFIVKSPTTVFNCPNNKLGRMCKKNCLIISFFYS